MAKVVDHVSKTASAKPAKPLKLLCLHSFRTSAAIFRQQLRRSGLDEALKDLVQLDFIDAPHPASGPAPPDVQAYFQPPYYEWCNARRQTEDGRGWEYVGVGESEQYVIDHLIHNGPYDGIVAFSQGALMASALLAMKQAGYQEVASMPDLRLVLCIGSAKSRYARHMEAFEALPDGISCRSLHIIGDRDQWRVMSLELLKCFQDPQVITHPRGHIVPALQGESLQQLRSFLLAAMPQPAL